MHGSSLAFACERAETAADASFLVGSAVVRLQAMTPLMLATLGGHLKLAELLLQRQTWRVSLP